MTNKPYLRGLFFLGKNVPKTNSGTLTGKFEPLRGNKKTLRRFDEESFFISDFRADFICRCKLSKFYRPAQFRKLQFEFL